MNRICFLIGVCLCVLFSACSEEDEKITERQVSPYNCLETVSGPDQSINYSSSADSLNPLLYQQWALKNQNQTAFASSTTGSFYDMNVDEVHNTLNIKGRGIKVLVTDDSFECHPDLSVDSSLSSDFLDGDNFPQARANNGSHGTSVAGLIGMVDNNGIGGVGVAPRATLSGNNYVSSGNVSASAEAEVYGAKVVNGSFACWNDGPRIVNHSWGYFFERNYSAEDIDLLASNYKYLANNCGLITVRAAGNSYRSTIKDYSKNTLSCSLLATNNGLGCSDTAFQEHLASPYLIAVSAMNGEGRLASYSTYGSGLWVTGPAGEFPIGNERKNMWVLPDGNIGSDNIGGSLGPAMITSDTPGCSSGYSRSFVSSSSSSLASDNDFEFPWKRYQGNVPLQVKIQAVAQSTQSLRSSAYAYLAPGPESSAHSENPNCDYTSTFNGTSSASPNVAGVVALILEANPNMKLRDVKHVLAATAQKVDASSTDIIEPGTSLPIELAWKTNAAGYHFSPRYGFGLPNAKGAVDMALSWKNNPSQMISPKTENTHTASSQTVSPNQDRIITDAHYLEFSIAGAGSGEKIENITLFLSANHGSSSGLSRTLFKLVSPSGTEAIVLRPYNYLVSENTFAQGNEYDRQPVIVNNFYGEAPNGNWRLYMYDLLTDSSKLSNVSAEISIISH